MSERRFSGNRQTRFTVSLLDGGGTVKRRLRRVSGGEVSVSAGARMRSSGSLEIAGDERIDWLTDMAKIEIDVNGMSWPLGVFVFASPKVSFTDEGATWSVELLSTLTMLAQQVIDAPMSVAAGTEVTQYVRGLLSTAWKLPVSIVSSDRVVNQAMVWEAGTSYQRIINDLLGAIGYWSLWVDESGTLQVAPYVRPAARPVAWEFEEGSQAIHSAQWTRDVDIAAVPNKVICVGQGSQDTPALVGTAVNSSSSSPYSYGRRGRWVTKVETGVEASSQEVINEIARRKLIEASDPQSTLDVKFLPIPLEVNSVVRWKSQGVDILAVVNKWKIDLNPTALCSATLKEVVDL